MRAIDADALRHEIHCEYSDDLGILDHIDAQPTIQPKKGRWISADAMFHGVPFYCSECGENTRDTVMGKPRWKFCPNCGAKMEVNNESN